MTLAIFLRPSIFQFTPLREGRREHIRREEAVLHFNSRPSARGDPNLRNSLGQTGQFQFTPLREGRLELLDDGTALADISIHAPPRGATFLAYADRMRWRFQFTPLREGRRRGEVYGLQWDISIHAPPRGATTAAIQAVNPVT